MPNSTKPQQGLDIATAQVADACIKEKIPYVIAPAGLTPVISAEALPQILIGKVIPVRHYGSVDVFLEVLETTQNLDNAIMVIDNYGRTDEACIGDLVVLEAKNAGIQAILVWGLHRDTRDLKQIGLPVFSYGSYPSGPTRLDERGPEAFASAQIGTTAVTSEYTAFVDLDGAIFVQSKYVEQIIPVASAIRNRELKQAQAAAQGNSLRKQFSFAAFLKHREADPQFSFRQHLRTVMSSIEE